MFCAFILEFVHGIIMHPFIVISYVNKSCIKRMQEDTQIIKIFESWINSFIAAFKK